MPHITTLNTNRVVVAVLVLLLLAAACATKPQRSPLMHKDATLTKAQARIAAHVFVDRFSGLVEESADKIIAASQDREVRQNALLWKINAVSAGQRAGFQDDPVAGYLDLWILCEQMALFFEDGPGTNLFGEHQQIAIDISKWLSREAEAYAREISGRDLAEATQEIETWVEANPLTSLSFSRVSTRTLVLKLMKKHGSGTFAAIGSLDEGLNDLADRSTIYAEYVPKMAMWQVEYLFDEIMQREDIAETLRDVRELSGALGGIDSTADELMMLLDEGIAETLPAEREILTKFIDEQRVAVLDFVRNERIAVLQDLAKERAIVLAAVSAERVAVTKDVEKMRAATIDDLQGIQVNLEDSWKRIESIIDRVFLRVALLAGALVVVMIVFGFAALRTIRTLAS